MSVSYDYDLDYEPVAPIMPIGLSRAGKSEIRKEITALIDTGADATMIPVDV